MIKRFITLFCFFLFFILNLNAPGDPYFKVEFETYFEYYIQRREELRNSKFDLSGFQEYLRLRNVPNREIIIAQAILETGLFTSPIFYENNNLFGMKEPRVRETTAIGSSRGHATYDNWVDSVDDYILWYNYVTRNRVYEDYLQFLVYIGYAEDPYYLKKLLILKET